jgi:hypothetical protein
MRNKPVLVIIGIVLGVFAALLVVSFDFSSHRSTLFVVLAGGALIDIVLLGLAYKKGRLGTHSPQFSSDAWNYGVLSFLT